METHHKVRFTRLFLGSLICTLLMGTATFANLVPLWEQAPTQFMSGTQSSAEAYPATLPSNAPQRVADDFVAGTSASILAVTWWGASSDGLLGEIDNIDQVTAFKIEFFATDPATQGVGTSLYSAVVAAGQTHSTRTALEMLGGSDVFQHTVTLSNPVDVTAGQRYWFSVSAYRTDDPLWDWFHGQSSNYKISVDNNVNGVWGDSPTTPGVHQDMAFVISVPEPATVILLSLGSIVLTRRQRKNRV